MEPYRTVRGVIEFAGAISATILLEDGILPSVKNRDALAKVYAAAKRKIDANDIPTLLLEDGRVLFRSINPMSRFSFLPRPGAGMHVSKRLANPLLAPADGPIDLSNRFSGPSYWPAIPCAAGLYCVLQQQALVNESTHYSGKAPVWALAGRCVLRMRIMGSILVADLSPHNPRARRFLRELGAGIWEQMTDPKDCSIARGIGLAIANSRWLHGVAVETVRESERSGEERGDNLVLFATPGSAVSNLYIDEARFYGRRSDPEIFPVAFP